MRTTAIPKYSLLLISVCLNCNVFIVSINIGYNVEYFCLIPPGQSSHSVPPVTGNGMSTNIVDILSDLALYIAFAT